MDCQIIKRVTAWECSQCTSARGEDVMVIAPPVSFWDGSIVPVYVFDHGAQIEITDDGGLLEHFDISGFAITSDKRRRRGLEKSLAKWNVTLSDELQLWCKPEELASGLQRYIGAMFSAAHWEAENAGRAIDSGLLIAEAEMYLRALNPTAAVLHDVALLGISGRHQSFPLRLDQTYYDAVGPHPASSAAMVKKLFDVRLVRETKDTPITVVVDDRANPERSKADINIFTQLAHVKRFASLQAEAMKVMTAQ